VLSTQVFGLQLSTREAKTQHSVTSTEHPGPMTFLCFTAIYKWIFKNKPTHLFILESWINGLG